MKSLSQKKNLHPCILFAIICLLNLHCQNDKPKVAPAPVEPLVLTNDDLDKLNYMRLSDGKFWKKQPIDRVPITFKTDLTSTFDSIISNEDRVVIYFHGGLMRIQKAYTDPKGIKLDNVFRKANYFPFYVLYGGGPINILWTSLDSKFLEEKKIDDTVQNSNVNSLDSSLEEGSKSKSFKYLMIQFHRRYSASNVEDKFEPASRKTYEIIDTNNLEAIFHQELNSGRSSTLFKNDFVKNKVLMKKFEKNLMMDESLQDISRKEIEKQSDFVAKDAKNRNFLVLLYNIFMIIGNTSDRFIRNRHHGLMMTISEEILLNSTYAIAAGIRKVGQGGWEESKQQVKNAFNPNGNDYGGTALLDELVRVDSARNVNNQSPLKVFLVGSSTGTIMICNLLQAASTKKYKNLSFNVIFSVPSCTMELFAQTLIKAQKQISSFHMFALSDSVEKKASFIPVIYPGTILYFVSGLCETNNNECHDAPLVGMQRFYQDGFLENEEENFCKNEKSNIEKVKQFLDFKDGKSKKVVWSQGVSEDGKLSNNGTTHKGVIRDSAVQSSIFYLLTH